MWPCCDRMALLYPITTAREYRLQRGRAGSNSVSQRRTTANRGPVLAGAQHKPRADAGCDGARVEGEGG